VKELGQRKVMVLAVQVARQLWPKPVGNEKGHLAAALFRKMCLTLG
jgi:hypothetical protein